MHAPHPEGLPELAKVIDLVKYRRDNPRFTPHHVVAASGTSTNARVYVDLDSRGHIAYGIAHADIENALFLLEPTLYLAGQLLKIVTDEQQ
jgi:hypothetical protein